MARTFVSISSVLISSLATLTACSGARVSHQQSPSADLWMYHSYAWEQPRPQNEVPDRQIPDRQIKDAVDRDLNEMGIVQVNARGNPDFTIAYDATHSSYQIQFVDAATKHGFWTGTASSSELSASELPASAHELMSSYRDSRDKSQTASEKAKFFFNIS